MTPAPRILAGWLQSQPRAAAMGKDRKKVGSAYVHIHTMFIHMHVYMYVPIFVRERVCARAYPPSSAAAMGEDRKKVGNAYVYTHRCR